MDLLKELMVIILMLAAAIGLILRIVYISDKKAEHLLLTHCLAAGEAEGYRFDHIDRGGPHNMIAADTQAGILCLVERKGKEPVHRFVEASDVLSSEISHKNVVIVEASRKSPLGRAAVGGVLFGGAGAVVGAVSGAKTDDAVRADLYTLHLTVNDLAQPYFCITFGDIDKAKHWQSLLEVLLAKARGDTE